MLELITPTVFVLDTSSPIGSENIWLKFFVSSVIYSTSPPELLIGAVKSNVTVKLGEKSVSPPSFFALYEIVCSPSATLVNVYIRLAVLPYNPPSMYILYDIAFSTAVIAISKFGLFRISSTLLDPVSLVKSGAVFIAHRGIISLVVTVNTLDIFVSQSPFIPFFASPVVTA